MTNTNSEHEYVLRIEAPDQPGIMTRVASIINECVCDIRDANVYGDPQTGKFYARMQLRSMECNAEEFWGKFKPVSEEMGCEATVNDCSRKTPVLIAVSKSSHCLSDILHKWKIGTLPIDIVGVVSNHPNLRSLVEWHGLNYTHLPITPETKPEQEVKFKALIEETGAELTVLARYMQVLSDEFSAELSGRCINIHHSFLPSFKGARPYHQAHDRGVKLIGATAHYVTADLDEGPIIEQEVRRITHKTTAEEMVEIGREVEASVLSRAIKWHAEHRVFTNRQRTVVM